MPLSKHQLCTTRAVIRQRERSPASASAEKPPISARKPFLRALVFAVQRTAQLRSPLKNPVQARASLPRAKAIYYPHG